ncbi:MAG: hypothetical protein WBI14_00865 [Anaerolineaceae bacterium]
MEIPAQVDPLYIDVVNPPSLCTVKFESRGHGIDLCGGSDLSMTRERFLEMSAQVDPPYMDLVNLTSYKGLVPVSAQSAEYPRLLG